MGHKGLFTLRFSFCWQGAQHLTISSMLWFMLAQNTDTEVYTFLLLGVHSGTAAVGFFGLGCVCPSG